jgi:hypothetical protein
LRKPTKPATALLREHRLQHCEYRLRGLGRSGVAHQIGEFVTTCVNRAHVASEVVHEDFRGIWTTLGHHHLVLVVVVGFIVTKGVHEPLHDAYVLNIRRFFHHIVFHVALLT